MANELMLEVLSTICNFPLQARLIIDPTTPETLKFLPYVWSFKDCHKMISRIGQFYLFTRLITMRSKPDYVEAD